MKSLKDLRIIFMGTPEFAVASLDKLSAAGCNIVAVITAPDKPSGRGMHMQQSPVKQYAESKSLQLLQPPKLKDPEFIKNLRSLNADIQVVVAFRMLPEIVWNMPPMGTVNVHGSLLPQYRGAAPINWAIINGEKFTGVTTFRLKHEIDTGDILLNEKIPIGEKESAGELHDRMKFLGADLLLNSLEGLARGSLKEKPQEDFSEGKLLKHAPKIFTETCNIDWNKKTDDIFNLIRGLSPYPAAYTQLDNKKLKIFDAEIMKEITAHAPGIFVTDHKNWLKISCIDGYISILSLQLEGKKRMPVEDFLRGYRFQ